MNYTYKAIRNSDNILRSDGACIPPDEANFDYREFLRWQAQDGGVLGAADPAPAPTQEALDQAAAAAYPKLAALRNMAPAQVQAWVDANVTDLASARDAIKTLAIAVSVLARRIK